MTKRAKKAVGANLTLAQKASLKDNILRQYPNLATFEDEVDALIEEYSKDKGYIDKLMECKGKEVKEPDQVGTMKHLSTDDPEYATIKEKMDKAYEQMLEDQKKAIQEYDASKEKCDSNYIDNVTTQA
jgi:hypothetical protein